MDRQGGLRPPAVDPRLKVRAATPADNEALIRLELESGLLMGDTEEFFDRSPDAFAACAPHPGCYLVCGEIEGRLTGMMAGLVHSPLVQGEPRTLVYIHRARVHPEFHHHGVAWALSNHLFAWSARLGATGPYYAISPANERSVAFGGRAGGCWPVPLRLAEYDVSDAATASAGVVHESELPEAAALINASHAREDLFEPLTAARLAQRRAVYGPANLLCLREQGRITAVAGLWDKGATTERIDFDLASGAVSRTRTAAVVDWGFRAGSKAALATVLRALAARAREWGRAAVVICEPVPGALPDAGLPRHTADLNVYTPALTPPQRESIAGLFCDLLYL